jgi:hypothetical protein
MDIGTAGFLSTCVLTGGGIALKMISSRVPKPSNNGNGKQPVCPVHGEIVQRLKNGDECMENLKRSSEKQTVLLIRIASQLKIPLEEIEEELAGVITRGKT